MPNTIANVLTGVASLAIRQPNDARAEWSTEQQYVGTQSVKLTKGGTGNAGSTHVELTFPTPSITLAAFVADPTDYSFWHYSQAVTGNFMQFELRFEDPDSDAWVEATVADLQGYTGTAAWVQNILAGADVVGFGGIGELGASFFDWDLGTTVTDLVTDIDAKAEVTSSGEWLLARVRIELWESSPARYAFIDQIEIDGTTYAVEPGGNAPGLSLSSAFTEIGYTEDGLTLEYNAETSDIMVEEETFAIDRVITKETMAVTCSMAETSLENMKNAMAGSVLSGSILKLGGGAMKTMNLRVEGTNPAGYKRQIFFPKCTTMGTVGIPFKKGEKTLVPVTFQALKPQGEDAVTIVDNAA